ncbi:MAG: RNA polymerase sigma factor [Sphingobacteriaceae bacterium]
MLLEHKYTIEDLVHDCKNDRPKAQEQLYKLFAAKMLGVCMRYASSKMEAEDMLQNGFIKVFGKLKDYRAEGSFEGWIRRIMVHTSIEYYRKHHKMMQVITIDNLVEDPAVSPLATANLRAQDLLNLIRQLSPGYRLVFNMYAIEGYSHKEIAGTLGITEGASKSQLSRARSILKEQIAKMEGRKYEHVG